MCLVTGTGFALFAGRSVTRRRSADAPAAVTQSVELVPRCQRHSDKSADDDVDSLQPGVPLMTQDFDVAPRCDMSAAALDNNILHRHSQSDFHSAESTPPLQFTHSQLISIV